MKIFSVEHGRAAYRADFALYAVAVVALSALLLARSPSGHGLAFALSALAGLLGWSAIEYGLHRFVLHGIAPFSRWHAQHHARPMALICTPTVLSAALIATFVFLPAALAGDRWLACALTLGLVVGYLGHAVTHHATHHWRGGGAWLLRRKRWHALHHHDAEPSCYGVTSAFWDHVFGTTPRRANVRQRTDGSGTRP